MNWANPTNKACYGWVPRSTTVIATRKALQKLAAVTCHLKRHSCKQRRNLCTRHSTAMHSCLGLGVLEGLMQRAGVLPILHSPMITMAVQSGFQGCHLTCASTRPTKHGSSRGQRVAKVLHVSENVSHTRQSVTVVGATGLHVDSNTKHVATYLAISFLCPTNSGIQRRHVSHVKRKR